MNRIARLAARFLFCSSLLTPVLILSSLFTPEAKAVSVELTGSRSIISGTDCDIATYRYRTNTIYNGQALDLLVEVLGEDNEYTNGPSCVGTSSGKLAVRIRDKDSTNDIGYVELKVTVVEKDTTTPVEVDRLTVTSFDLDTNTRATPTGTDDTYFQAPDSVYISEDSEVQYSGGSFFGGQYQAKLKGTDQRNCSDTPDNPENACRASAVFTSGANGINRVSSVVVRMQNDDAYGQLAPADEPTSFRLFRLSFEIEDFEPTVTDNTDYGDAPGSYGSAGHSVGASIALGYGNIPDHDVAYQASTNADGDDTDATTVDYDDEDGVQLGGQPLDGQSLTAGATSNLDVASFGTGYLSAWIDLDGDGNFTDADEQVVDDLFINSTTVENTAVPIAIPATATAGNSYMRFRFASAQGIGPTGLSSSDGEVEDYRVAIAATPSIVEVSRPLCRFTPTTRPGSLAAWLHNVPVNTLTQDGYWSPSGGGNTYWDTDGQGVDQEVIDGRGVTRFNGPGVTGTATNTVGAISGIDQPDLASAIAAGDYVQVGFTTLPDPSVATVAFRQVYLTHRVNGGTYQFAVAISTDPTFGTYSLLGEDLQLTGGDWSTLSGFASGSGSAVGNTFTFTNHELLEPSTTYYIRTYFYNRTTPTDRVAWDDFNLRAGDCLDWGDAPDSYNTTLALDGPRHIAVNTAPYLGADIDIEGDGQPDATALGDDNDEDGATLPALMTAGETLTVPVNINGTGHLNVWFDWNNNGDFNDAGEQIVVDQSVTAGSTNLSIAVPSDAAVGTVFARFRLCSVVDNCNSPTGLASDGEVEDYQAAIAAAAPTLPPFTCSRDFYQTLAEVGQVYELRKINFDTNPVSFDLISTFPDSSQGIGSINAIGYNIQDNYIYGLGRRDADVTAGQLNTQLVRIGSDGSYEFLGSITDTQGNNPLTGGWAVGSMDDSGHLYAVKNATVHKINVSTRTYEVLIPTGSGAQSDWAYNPRDGKFYAVLNGSNTLRIYDPVTNSISQQTLAGSSLSAAQGAAFFGPDGALYAIANAGGPNRNAFTLYKVDLSTLTITLVTEGDNRLRNNDGTNCPDANTVDFGDAPDSYNTAFDSNGPRHIITPTLRLGGVNDAETDATVSVDATGDGADEDGVVSGLSLTSDTTSHTVQLQVTNNEARDATLIGWIDFDGNNTFDSDEVATQTITASSGATTPTLSWTNIGGSGGPDIQAGTTFARFRITADPISATDIGGGFLDGEVEDYQVAIAQPVVTNPDVILVKRITAINGNRTENTNDTPPITLNTVVNDGVANSADDEANWPANYLLGELDAGLVKPGDEIEYTIYFLNAGSSAAEDVRICDWIQPNQSFVVGKYGGNDIELVIGGTTYNLTDDSDAADRGEVTTIGSLSATSTCNLSGFTTNASDEVVVVDITGTTGDPAGLTTFPGTTGQGTPTNAYGFFRFTTKVDE